MADQRVDELFGLGAVSGHLGQGLAAGARAANIGFLIGIELRVHEEPVFEIVNAEFGGLFVGNGTQVSGDLEAPRMSGVDGGFQLVTGDVHVGFKRSDATVGPEIDGLGCVVGSGEVVHLDEVAGGAFQIGAGDIDVWAGQFARIDVVPKVQVCVGFDAAGGAHSRDASRKVETWGGKRQL